MIVSFGSKDTQRIWNGERAKSFPGEIQEVSRRKLRMLNKSQFLVDLRFRPANRLEKLKGDLNEFYSIRMNDQWRIAFRWHNGNAKKVEIIDNH